MANQFENVELRPVAVVPSSSAAKKSCNSCKPVSLAWKEVSYSVELSKSKSSAPDKTDLEKGRPSQQNRKVILNHISGIVKPGEVCFVLGPSGCGKTTLLDFLARRINTGLSEGEVLVNGEPVSDAVFKSVAAYVPQEDSLIGDLTVEETLRYAARFSIPSGSLSEAKRDERVSTILKELGLESCRETYIGTIFRKGISGGQKRRLSIAVELITNPSLIFLDEPTSGLDSTAAYNVMSMLTRLAAEQNRAIICTIHQPSSEVFQMCSKVMLLSRGRLEYFGSPGEVVAHFTSLGYACPPYSNPADYLLNLLNTDFDGHADTEALARSFSQSDRMASLQTAIQTEVAQKHKTEKRKDLPNLFLQLGVLVERTFLTQIRNPGVYWIRLGMYIALSIMLGLLYTGIGTNINEIQDRVSILFFIAAFMVFMSIAVLPTFIMDRAVFVRERANGLYGPLAYVLSNTICSVPGILLITLSSSCIVYWWLGLGQREFVRFVWFALNLFLSLYVAEGFMYLVSSIVPYFIVGLMAAAGVFGMFMLVEGFFVIRDNLPKYWIWAYYLAFHTYSFDAFMYNEFEGLTFNGTYEGFNVSRSGKSILKDFSMEKDNRARDMLVLAGMAFAYRVGFYVWLKIFHTGKR